MCWQGQQIHTCLQKAMIKKVLNSETVKIKGVTKYGKKCVSQFSKKNGGPNFIFLKSFKIIALASKNSVFAISRKTTPTLEIQGPSKT